MILPLICSLQSTFNPPQKVLYTHQVCYFVNSLSLTEKRNHFGKLDVFDFGLSPLQLPMVDWGPV